MTFKELNLKVGNRLIWDANSNLRTYWVGKVTRISESHLSVAWIHVLNGQRQATQYPLNYTVYEAFIYDEAEFAQYLDLFKQE